MAEVVAIKPGVAGDERVRLLGLGDALMNAHGDLRSALAAYLKSAECGPAAKWEFGARLLEGIDHGKIAGDDLTYVATTLAAYREPIIVPDLWRGIARTAVKTLGRREAEIVLDALLATSSQEMIHEIVEASREAKKPWAASRLLQHLSTLADAGEYSPGMGFYLKLGHSLFALGRVKEAVTAYSRADKLAPNEARLHMGAHLREFLSVGDVSSDQIKVLIDEMDRAGLIVSDLAGEMLGRVLAWPPGHDNVLLADKLVKALDAKQLIVAADKALAKADHSAAVYCYEEAIKKEPQDVLTRLQIGITHFLANEHKQAEAHFSTLLTLQQAERERWGVDKLPVRVMHWTWLQAFGHITCLDTYIKAVKLGWLPDHRTLLAFDRTNPPAGWRMLSYFSKYLDVVGVAGETGPALDKLIFGDENSSLSSHQKDVRRASLMYSFWALPNREGRMRYFGNIGSDVQRAWKETGKGPLLEIEEDERARFRMVMEQSLGLPQDAWFVLLHVRESSFKPGWEAHHQYTRNASIDAYDAAIDDIVSKGGWVIRAGDPSMRRIRPRKNVIDYATSPMRSPELDILLCSECKFFLGTNSGFSLAPPLFGRRCVLTNWSPLANPNWYPDDIFIPKLVRERKGGRYLTIEEMYQSKAGWSQFVRDFQTDWEKLDNSPEEIVDVVLEMMAELDGKLDRSPAAKRREQAYHDIIVANDGYIGSRMSDGFLERNSWLLDKGKSGLKQAAPVPPKLGSPSSGSRHAAS